MNGTGRARTSTAGFTPNAALATTVISDSPALTLDLLVRRDGCPVARPGPLGCSHFGRTNEPIELIEPLFLFRRIVFQ